jgi:hypothetical protein
MSAQKQYIVLNAESLQRGNTLFKARMLSCCPGEDRRRPAAATGEKEI